MPIRPSVVRAVRAAALLLALAPAALRAQTPSFDDSLLERVRALAAATPGERVLMLDSFLTVGTMLALLAAPRGAA